MHFVQVPVQLGFGDFAAGYYIGVESDIAAAADHYIDTDLSCRGLPYLAEPDCIVVVHTDLSCRAAAVDNMDFAELGAVGIAAAADKGFAAFVAAA